MHNEPDPMTLLLARVRQTIEGVTPNIEDLEQTVRLQLQPIFDRFELVSRQELEAQLDSIAILERSVADLEQRIAELEAQR